MTKTEAPQLNTIQLPAIGALWPEHGGHFAGILRGAPGQPDCALIIPTGPDFEIKGQWGEYGQDVPGATSHTDSLTNTRAMAEAGSAVAQAVLAITDADGRADYAIPSAGAMAIARANAPELFAKEIYWTSTQAGRYLAVAQDFADSSSGWTCKDSSFLVRPVRTIQL